MKSASRRTVRVTLSVLALAVSIAACAAPPSAKPAASPASDKEKLSYAIGMQVGTSLKGSLDEVKGDVDPAIVLRALTTVVNGGQTQMSIPEAQAVLQAYGKKRQEHMQVQQKVVAQKNLADGNAFLAANAKKPGVKTTPSGLQYQVIKQGAGPKPKATDSVKVNYVGTLLDGSTFDSSAKAGGPVQFQVDQVIPGWTEGLQLMNAGSKFVFWVPAKLGYGESPRGPGGPNSMLKFEVELVQIGGK